MQLRGSRDIYKYMRKYQSDVIQKKTNFEDLIFLTNNISKNHKKEHLGFIRDMLIVEIEKYKHTSHKT